MIDDLVKKLVLNYLNIKNKINQTTMKNFSKILSSQKKFDKIQISADSFNDPIE